MRACGFVSVYAVVCALPLLVQLCLEEQWESTHNSINRDKATCPHKVVPRNNNKAKSSSAKGTIASVDGQLLVTETCRVTRDTNILMF
jgi:hypothetical protein